MRTLIVALVVLTSTATTYAGRPLVTNDSGTVPPLRLQLETGLDYTQDANDNHLNTPVVLTLGILDNLEAQVAFGWQFAVSHDDTNTRVHEDGCTDLGLAAKYRFLAQDQFLFDHAIAVAINMPTASRTRGLGSGRTDYDITYILSRTLVPTLDLHLNLGYTFVGNHADVDTRDFLHYSAALTWQINDHFQPVVEIIAETPTQGGKTALGVNAGLRYFLTPDLMFDIALGTKLAADYPDLTASLGLTYVF